MVLNLTPNIQMSLVIRAKEEALIGRYEQSLETFRTVQAQIQAHVSELSHELEHGDASQFESAEKEYSEWSHTQKLLEEEFALVHQIMAQAAAFKGAPGEKQAAAEDLANAQLQAQHLAQQQATDVRDPDVWPPPTPQEPASQARHTKATSRSSSQWGAPVGVPARAAAAAAAPITNRTPIRQPVPEDDDDVTSGRLPNWASGKGGANAPPPARQPKPLVRQVSKPPPQPVQPVVQASAAASSSNDSKPARVRPPGRKPGVPTNNRKPSAGNAAAAGAGGGKKSAAASKGGDGAEDGSEGRPKFEAHNKEEQEMADMIEREILDKKPNVKMQDIAGLAGPKQLLMEAVVLPRLIPGYFTGKRKPWKGVLMFGPPGTGKTLLAKAVATECGTTFFNVSPSTVTSKFRGDSEKLMKLLFEMARFYAPSTIFMDEVDGLCSSRGGGGEHEASRRVKGEILQQMDGAVESEYDPARSVIVLGATNLPWELDTAFLRRFEKRVHIDLPDAPARAEMFTINTEGMPVDDDVRDEGKWGNIVNLSEGYSGADIAVVCKDASMLGLRRLLAGKSPAEIRAMPQSSLNATPISAADFEQVFATVKSTAGKNDLEKYREWMKEFGSAI